MAKKTVTKAEPKKAELKKELPKKVKKVARSSETGEFVSKAEAKRKPKETVVETIEIDTSLHLPPPEEFVEIIDTSADDALALELEAAEQAVLAEKQGIYDIAEADPNWEMERNAMHAVVVAERRQQVDDSNTVFINK